MNHFLIIGIIFQKFKKPAKATIYLGDYFIDEFELNRDYPSASNILPQIETSWYEKLHIGHYLTSEKWLKRWETSMPGLLKVYEIDDRAITGKLEIKIENTDSNYSNGFMNKYSLIQFPITALIEKSKVKNLGEKMMNELIRYDNATCIYHDDDAYLTYDHSWPNAWSFYAYRENETYQKSAITNVSWWVGGSFTAEFHIKTKHNMKYLVSNKDIRCTGFPRTGRAKDLLLASYKPLLNIYNENNRGNNTPN